jgi:phenylalanyl-tRNA synthetase beta chain
VRLFDVYTGAQVGPGKKSLAFALRLRAADHTLSATEVAAARAGAIAAATARCGASLRE